MDIIAAHQQGLIERLDEECQALAGRPRDFAQRAVVLHHLYDHSGGAHGWALLEARRQLAMGRAIDRMAKRAKGLWLAKRREPAIAAVDALAADLGEQGRRRCAAAYRAYRMTATAALEEEAGNELPSDLALLLGECHARRRAGVPLSIVTRGELAIASEEHVGQAGADWSAIDRTPLARAARKTLTIAIEPADIARAEKKGWERLAAKVRGDKSLPASFRANPAQHFFALQHGMAEKKRKQIRDACDAEGDTVALAA